MEHITIDYGIDLGTTNSAISRVNEGVPTIIKSEDGMETMPSCISFKKNGSVRVGFSAYSDLERSKLKALKNNKSSASNSCIEFKRFMGSDTIYSDSFTEHQWTPEELSAKIISSLCAFVTDEQVRAAVITVPAKFTANQKDATLQAARMAGLEQVELLQEPIAASMAYGLLSQETEGIWMVFDLGGGTLDVALVNNRDGIMQVFDTEGDNYLGGKNLDEAIVSKILLPELLERFYFDTTDTDRMELLSNALKVIAEKLKKTLSYKDEETVIFDSEDWGEDDNGDEIDMELTVSRERLETVIRPILQKAVDVCKTLMIRNGLDYGRLSHLILIGGPTYIPLLRKMLREQVTQNVETRIDPMTAVAQGAALYASTIPLEIVSKAHRNGNNWTDYHSDGEGDIGAREDTNANGESGTIELEVTFDATTVDEETYITILPKSDKDSSENSASNMSKWFHSKGKSGKELYVRLLRTQDKWQSKPVLIGEKGNLILVPLLPRCVNTFIITAEVDGQIRPVSPAQFSIVHGTKVGTAILPYNIGIEVYNLKKDRRVFTSLHGLEKNRPLPASGTVYGLKTMSDIYAGDENTRIRIAIYQGDNGAEGKTAALYEYISDVVITGDDVSTFIQKDSLVNVRINVDRSEQMEVICEFPTIDEKVEKQLQASKRHSAKTREYLQDLISSTYSQLTKLSYELDDLSEINHLKQSLSQVEDSLVAGVQAKQVEQHLKEIMRQVESFEIDSEWERAKNALDKALFSLKVEAAKHSKDEGVKMMVASFDAQVSHLAQLKDKVRAQYLQKQIEDYQYTLGQAELYRSIIRTYYYNFSQMRWTQPSHAQKLVNKAMEILRKDPEASLSQTKEITETLYKMVIRDKNGLGSSSSSSSSSSSINDILSI